MKVADILNKTDKTLFSFELLPPKKGNSIGDLYAIIDQLVEFNPPYINITYHREEVIYKPAGNGLLKKKTVRKRPGTVAIAAAIKYKYKDVEVVPHLICGGFTKEETEDALIDLNFLGIENLLLLRGDPQPSQKKFIPEPGGHQYAIDLIKQVTDLNKGIYLDEDLSNKTPTNFSFGVAGYPEKHIESPNLQSDIYFLKKKVEAGAEFIVTQMFFDNKKYFDFVKICRENGINVPIIPGIKPVSVKNHLYTLPGIFNIDLPEDLVKEILKCKNDKEVRKLGVEWATFQSKELIKAGVPAIHYYTMGRPDNIYKIANNVF